MGWLGFEVTEVVGAGRAVWNTGGEAGPLEVAPALLGFAEVEHGLDPAALQLQGPSLLDRLLHHNNLVATDGESYRMREARTRRGGRPPMS